MSEDAAKKPEVVGPDEEVRFDSRGRVLAPAFAARIGNWGGKKHVGASRKKPLTEALEELVEENPELAKMVAIKLFKLALNDGNMRAIELIYNRLDGLVKIEKKSELPAMTVNIQQIVRPNAPTAQTPNVEPPREVEGDDDGAPDPDSPEARRLLRRIGRNLPQVKDVIGDRHDEDEHLEPGLNGRA